MRLCTLCMPRPRLLFSWLFLLATGLNAAGAQTPPAVTRASFDSLFRHVTNAGRWGRDDSLGTLNLISPALRAAAARDVRSGITVSLARQLVVGPNRNALIPLEVRYLRAPAGDIHWFVDAPLLPMHGWAFSHIDALAHAGFAGSLYNGQPASSVDTLRGASRLGITVMREGIVTRGVLIDVPRLRGVQFLDSNAVITAADLDAWEQRTGVRVQAGDAVLIRTGRGARETSRGAWTLPSGAPGPHPEVARWLHARNAAVLGGDGANERYPSLVPGLSEPLHVLALVAMGMPTLDDLALDELAAVAAARNQWTFLLVVAPLPVPGGSGSLVNALAIF